MLPKIWRTQYTNYIETLNDSVRKVYANNVLFQALMTLLCNMKLRPADNN